MPTKQERIWWLGKEGKKCTEHINVDLKERAIAFREIIGNLPIKKILEVGCNKAHNLVALSMLEDYELHGIDPNEYALNQARPVIETTLTKANAFNIPYPDSYFDLVFSCAVLMHITNRHLPKAIQEICRVSNRYVLVIEYSFLRNRIHYDEYWDVALRWKSTDYIVFRDYSTLIPGCKTDGPINMVPLSKNLRLHWWLFELDKK